MIPGEARCVPVHNHTAQAFQVRATRRLLVPDVVQRIRSRGWGVNSDKIASKVLRLKVQNVDHNLNRDFEGT